MQHVIESDQELDRLMAQHHCLTCGWHPIEGMKRYLEIHGTEAYCMRCNGPLPSLVEEGSSV